MERIVVYTAKFGSHYQAYNYMGWEHPYTDFAVFGGPGLDNPRRESRRYKMLPHRYFPRA